MQISIEVWIHLSRPLFGLEAAARHAVLLGIRGVLDLETHAEAPEPSKRELRDQETAARADMEQLP
jgi:hypothetical protein